MVKLFAAICQNSHISPKEKPPPTVKADEGSHRRSKPLLVRVKFSFWDPLHELGFDLDEALANSMPYFPVFGRSRPE